MNYVNVLKFWQAEKPLDDVSNLINGGGIPNDAQLIEKLGEEGAHAFGIVSPAFYNVYQRSGNRTVLRHFYDLVIRGKVREKYSLTPFQTQVAIAHDSLEDILKRAIDEMPVDGLRPTVAAYVMADALDPLLNPMVIYGVSINEDKGTAPKKYGGVISETDFNAMIAKPVLENPAFLVKNGNPKFEIERQDKAGYVLLTPYGKEFFLSMLDGIYGNFKVTEEDILKTYEFIKARYRRFLDIHLPNSGLPVEEQRIISDKYVTRAIATIEDKLKSGGIIKPRETEENIMARYEHVRHLIASDNHKPADISLILSSESPHVITIEKTLYSDYISKNMREMIEAAKRVVGSGRIKDEPYQQFPIVKGVDLIDTTAGMGPNLDNMTSINRKDRIYLKEGASDLAELNGINTPLEDRMVFYEILNYLVSTLQFKNGKLYRDATRETDSMFNEDKEILGRMKEHNEDLPGIIRASKPLTPSMIRRFTGMISL